MRIVTSLSTHAVRVQNQIFLVKMKALCSLILIAIQLSRIADCCSSDNNLAVDNAFVSCSTIVSCKAKCYRGYIFSSGSTEEDYNCQNGAWIPMLSSCKRIPLVSVTYSAIWVFGEIITTNCPNISSRLNNLQETLEGTLAHNCRLLKINATVQFTHSFLAFQVHTNFKAVYNNFTNWEALDFCIRYNRDTFRNLQVIKSMFEGVTCGILNTSNMIHKDLFVEETNDICPSATELHNVSTSGDGMYIRYCDFTDIDSTITTTKSSTEPTQMRTSESPTIHTEVSFTVNNFSTSQRTSLEKEVLLTDETSNINHGTTLGTEVSSTNQSSRVNSSQITTIKSLSGERDLKVKSIIYIAAPTGGVFLISLIITFIVCSRKRGKDPENLTDDMKMTRDPTHRKDETSFKGDMIENELYKSADDVLDRDSNGDTTQAASDDYSTAPYSKEKNKNQMKVEQEEYSYPSKKSNFNEARHSVVFEDDTEGDLDVKASDVFQTPNHDSENSCDYAVVNKSRKM